MTSGVVGCSGDGGVDVGHNAKISPRCAMASSWEWQ